MPEESFWVFGYGSLMWRPGFPFSETHPARMVGYARSFCIYSTHHRGSHDRPGLVLGLDRGGACQGLAFRVAEADRRDVLNYLRAREQINGVYRECWSPVWLEGLHRQVLALAFIVERAHPSYAGRLPLQRQVHLIRSARGLSGANIEYLANTVRHLTSLGIRDRQLERMAVEAGALFTYRGSAGANPGAIDGLVSACRYLPATAPRMPPHQRRRFAHRSSNV